MKKGLLISTLAFVSALLLSGANVTPKASETKADNEKYNLTFDTFAAYHDCCCNINGWFPQTFDLEDSVAYLDFTEEEQYGYQNPGIMNFVPGREYRIEFDVKGSTTDGFAIIESKAGVGSTQLDMVINDLEYKKYSHDFVAAYSESAILFVQQLQISTVSIKNFFIYELSRPLAYGDTIGALPVLPEDATGWTIDGTNILTSETLFEFTEDKVAKPFYPSTFKNGFTVNGTCLTDQLSGSCNFESKSIEDGVITLTGVAGNAYWTNFVDVTAGETYYIVGKYKTTECSGVTIAVNNPWVTMFGGVGQNTRQYRSFFYKYTPNFTGSIQLLFQCAYNDAGKSTICIKDVYFGKGFEINYGSNFSDIPALSGDYECWKINDKIIENGNVNDFASSENIYETYISPLYKVFFPLKEYVGEEEISLNIPEVGNFDKQVLNVVEGHTYFVTFDLMTSEACGVKPFVYHNISGLEWQSVGYDGVNSTNAYMTLSYIYTVDFTGELELLIQNAYNDVPSNPVSFKVKNYKAYEVLKLHNGDTFDNLPECPVQLSKYWSAIGWKIGDDTLTTESTFDLTKDTFVTPILEGTKFTLSFNTEPEGSTIESIQVNYGAKLTNLPATPNASKGHYYVWAIDDQEISKDTYFNYETDKEATLVEKVYSYTITFTKMENRTSVTIESRSIEYGTKIAPFPAYTTDEDYLYHWEIDGVRVDEDSIYDYEGNKECKLISKKNQFMLYFKDKENNGSTLKAIEIKNGQKYGEAITEWPTAPAVSGYTFVGWSINGNVISDNDTFTFEDNMFVIPTYVKNNDETNGNKKGCGGSLIATSAIISSLSLFGICLIKGKKERN